MTQKPILEVLKGNKISPPPVWIMRQAGRYLPEYRKIREKVDFLTLCSSPELILEVVLQPLKRFPLDAAILFSDILFPVISMGIELRFDESVGPVIGNPLESDTDIDRLRPLQKDKLEFLKGTLQAIKREIPPSNAVIGFAGAPYTLASYLVEGGSTKNFKKIKSMMYNSPDSFKKLMGKLADAVIDFLEIQISGGADALQLFDTWAGQLSPHDYSSHVHLHSCRIINHFESRNIPVIHFIKNNSGLLPVIKNDKSSGLGISWETSLTHSSSLLPENVCLQGNLDPVVLLSTPDVIRDWTNRILKEMAALPNPCIYNLGHGILPQTPPDNLRIMLETVKSFPG